LAAEREPDAVLAWRAQSSKRNRLTVGYLAGWAAPNGGPLMPWIRLRQLRRFGTLHSRGPASLHPVLGSSLGTDLIFEFGPNLKNLRLDARPCSAGRHARTAGPILQKEPPHGGVSGGVGRSQWWPPEAAESTLTASVSSGKCLLKSRTDNGRQRFR